MRPAQLLQLLFIAAAALAVYSFVSAARDGERRRACTAVCSLRPEYAGYNRTAPDFELPTLDGGTLKLSSLRGKVVILNFWTKTCRPCLEEMPSLAEFAEIISRRSDDIVLITVNTDESPDDARNTLSSVLEGKKVPFVTAVDSENEIVAGKYGTKLYPETWYIDPQGVIRARFDGPRNWGDALFLELAEGLLQGKACQAEIDDGKSQGLTSQLCADLPVFGS